MVHISKGVIDAPRDVTDKEVHIREENFKEAGMYFIS